MCPADVITRDVWIGLGSNLGDSLELIRSALRRLDRSSGIKVIRASAAYGTKPLGVGEQPDFINGVAELEVTLSPTELLEHLLELEYQMGRRRFGSTPQARCIDLDLLLFGDQVLNSHQLTLPHSRMHQRAFVLAPLNDLCPGLEIPGQGSVFACLEAVGDQVVECLSDEKLWQG